jgi:DMSO/TMAO reductase YedYZ molybdopterin-dependent catalytic subunit
MQTLRRHKKLAFVAVLLVAVVIVAFFIVQNNFAPNPKVSPSPTFSPTPLPSTTPTSTPSPTATPVSSPTSSPTPITTVAPTISPPQIPVPYPTPSPIVLNPGEVLQYQGQNLDPIATVYQNAIAGTQYINRTTYRLTINGLVNKTLAYTFDDVVNHQKYQKVVGIYCVEGWNATILWEGILVKDLLDDAGVAPGAQVVIFFASDGYSTSLPLDYIVQNNIMIAYKMNGVPLMAETGWPFMLIAQSQYGYKWIKWITQIEVSNDTSYLGFWESRGYPNNATIP